MLVGGCLLHGALSRGTWHGVTIRCLLLRHAVTKLRLGLCTLWGQGWKSKEQVDVCVGGGGHHKCCLLLRHAVAKLRLRFSALWGMGL